MRKPNHALLSAFAFLAIALPIALPAYAYAPTDNTSAVSFANTNTNTNTITTQPSNSAKPASSAATSATAPKATSQSTTTTSQPQSASTAQTPSKAATTTPATSRPKPIEAKDISTSSLTSKGSIDVYLSLSNNGKADDVLVGADTPVSATLTMVTTSGGKATEVPINVPLAAGKTVELADGDKALRISGITKTFKDGDHFPLSLHFRSSPNLTLDVTVHKKSSLLGF